jgi:hypothetical protein
MVNLKLIGHKIKEKKLTLEGIMSIPTHVFVTFVQIKFW